MTKLLSLFLVVMCTVQLLAQDNPPLTGFDIKPSNSGPSFINDMAKDGSGNIYVTGVFGGNMETYGLTSAGSNDIFFAKFNSAGSLLWIKQIGGTGDDQAISIAFDQTGSTIFLAGVFSGTVDFDPNAGAAPLTSGGGRDPFLGRYTTDGAYMWIGNISGTADGQIRDIVCTSTDVYVTGLFYGTADFGFGGGVNNQTSLGVADAFIAGYAMSSGTINNIRIIGGAAGEDYGYSITTDASSNIYVTGVYNGTVNFGNTNLSSTGNMDMFCAKYTSNLSPVWAVSSGVNAVNDFGKAIAVDGSGNVYITGSWFTGVWIQKFNSSGVSQWSTSLCQFGGGIGEGESITVNTNGDVVIAGYFNSSTGFEGLCSGPYYFTSQGNNDSFVAKYKGADGSFKWVRTISTTGPEEYRAITSDAANNFITAGYWATSVSNYSLQLTKYYDDPPSQPTALTFSNVTTSAISVSFTPTFTQPIVGQGGYVVVAKAGSAPTEIPIDGSIPSDYLGCCGADILGTSNVVAAIYTGSSNSFTQGVLPNTEYHYAVYAFNGNGNYLQLNPLRGSQFSLATEPTAQPTNLTFNTFTQTSFNGAFTSASGGAAGYLVLRKTGSAPTGLPSDATAYSAGATIGDGVVSYSGPLTTFSQTGLTAGTSYYYQVFSYNGSGQSLNYRASSPLSNNTITIPPTPTAIAATSATQSSFIANWNSSTSAASYRLDVSSDNFATYVAGYNNKSVTGTTDVVNGLSVNTTYKYRVRAVNASGTSANSNEISQITVTATPVAIAATVFTQTGFTANWNSVAGATGYKLDVSDNNSFSTFVSGFSNKDVVATNSLVTGLSSGVTYYFRVRSYNSAGASINSNTISQITISSNPLAEAATSVSQIQFTANWSAVTSATGYRLDVSSDGFVTFVSVYNNKSVATTNDVVSGLSAGISYQYRVRAINVAGVSGNSNSISQITLPSTPSPMASTFTQASFKISWPTVTSAIDYSVDVSQDNFNTLLSGYPKTLVATFQDVIGLAPGTNYQYRVRSRNASGTSPNSASKTQITIPANPVSIPFSNETATSFIANWEVVEGAAGYYLDVTLETENFNTFVGLYNSKDVGLFDQHQVTGLTASTSYRYRVRAFNSAGASDYSLSKLAVTKNSDGSGGVVLPSVSVIENQNSQNKVKASITGSDVPIKIVFNHRKIAETDFSPGLEEIVSTSNTYETTVNTSYFDEIGMEYFFSVTDASGRTSESAKSYTYKVVPTQSIPALAAGGTVSSYRIISVPLKLESSDIRDVFATLISNYGGYNKEHWRLLRYQNGKNTDFDGLTTLGQGKSYWFNSLETADIKVSGQAVPFNQASPFQLQLERGWNQIGNPYLFNIDWDDVLNANSTADVDPDYLVFDPATEGFKKSNSIVSWSGGFVYANTSGTTLLLPVTLKNTAGGRKYKATDVIDYSIDQPNWFMPIKLTQAEGENDYIGFGMHPDAKLSKDRFDGQTVPRFIKYLELNSYHNSEFTPKFSRDVVPTSDAFTWTYTYESNFEGQEARLEWSNELLSDNQAQLFLYDTEAKELINMKKNTSYLFKSGKTRDFKFIFSLNEESLQPEANVVGKAFPNPFTSSVTIPFILSAPGGWVQITMYDLMGKKIRNLVNDQFNQGYHEVVWDGTDFQNSRVTQGMYLYEMTTESKKMTGRIILH